MLGFTRHERLDVKKPGPPPLPPEHTLEVLPQHIRIQTPAPQESATTDKIDNTKEILPAQFKGKLA